jgi:hypothetical protein
VKRPKINILISTIDSRIDQVKGVIQPFRDDVHYIISHQFTDEKYYYTPEELLRSDISISHIAGFGVSKSRNNAILLAEGQIGLFSDDDVLYNDNSFDLLIKTFEENPEVDLAIFKIKSLSGSVEYKTYPVERFRLKNVSMSVGTIEVAFRIDRIKEKGIRFDERFGAGLPQLIGSDENIFIHDCILAGLNVTFFPDYIVGHPFESTTKKLSPFHQNLNWVTGGYDARINGSIAILKAFGGTVKLLPKLIALRINPFRYLYQRLSAAIYILFSNSSR